MIMRMGGLKRDRAWISGQIGDLETGVGGEGFLARVEAGEFMGADSPLYKTTNLQQICIMKMVATRELAANSGRVMKELEREGVLVITKDGKPRSILLSTSDESLMEDLRDCLYARARRELMRAQMAAADSGASVIGMDEIEKEIRATRAARKP